ncbi:MAG: hypothetical protein O7D96_01050 [SAR324 cluster bacterium]|nr:hypothetical protein [SAR324 cluster bacterium]
MHCYICRNAIEDGAFHYNDHGFQVCKPCFLNSGRCFICRFPGKKLVEVPGLGLECEFCRGNVIGQGDDLVEIIAPFFAYLSQFGHQPILHPDFAWTERTALREMQTAESLRQEEFIDDFLRYCYPVYYRAGAFHLLYRMTKSMFVVHGIVQFAAADLARRFGLDDLAGRSPFHTLARGWAHWVGFEAAKRLGYDLERRQLRKWPELGGQGEFQRFEKMAYFKKPKDMSAFLMANLNPLARKHLTGSDDLPLAKNGTS